MIFHNLQTIFLHIGKTAGISVEKMLGSEAYDNRIPDYTKLRGWAPEERIYLQHATAETIRQIVGNQLFNHYYKFTIVRNPFARMVSVYFYLYKFHQHKFGDFTHFIEQLPELIQFEKVQKGSHYIPQVQYTKIEGKNICDYIAHFERLPQSLDQVCTRLKITSKLEHHNTHRHSKWGNMEIVEYYTKEGIKIIQNLFAEDFESFGYSLNPEIQAPTIYQTEQIINLCARVQQNQAQQHNLITTCNCCTNWEKLLNEAEEQGMGPLLHKHLASIEENLPDSFVIGLRLLSFRHRQTNALLIKSLQNVLKLLGDKSIPVLVLKGAALSQTLYPEIGLRPMRDIDLFLAKEDVQHAHAFLQKNGFQLSTSVIPEDHFHLPALFQTIDGFRVCIELHQDLLPTCPPYHRSMVFAELYQQALAFDVGGITAYTLATEEMLWHLYQHGFHSPLTYEQYKLISAADIISFVEARVDEIDWKKIESEYPELFNALPFFHFITPWSDRVLAKIPFKTGAVPSGVGERFKGWPQLRLSQQKDKGFLKILLHTFFPSQWWLLIYYAPANRFVYLWCRMVRHPLHILWWIRLYGSIFYKDNLLAKTDVNANMQWSSLSSIKTLIVAMYKKFN